MVQATSRSPRGRVPQRPELVKYLKEYKRIMQEKFGLLARGTDYVKYRTFKAGMGGLEFAFEVMKSDQRYKINLMGQDGSFGLIAAYEKVKSQVRPPKGYTFSVVDPSDGSSKWERIQIFVEPETEAAYLNDPERLADLTKEFIDSMAPVISQLKAA